MNGDSVNTPSLISKADNRLDSTVACNFHTISGLHILAYPVSEKNENRETLTQIWHKVGLQE